MADTTRKTPAQTQPELATRPSSGTRPSPESAVSERRELPELPDEYDAEPETSTLVSVFGSSSRTGEWEPPDITRAFAVFGNATLDFTEALLPPGVTEVEAYALFSEVKVIVPDGLDVEVTGTGVLGDFRQTSGMSGARRVLRRTLRAARGEPSGSEEEVSDDAPMLRVSGVALLSTVKVITR